MRKAVTGFAIVILLIGAVSSQYLIDKAHHGEETYQIRQWQMRIDRMVKDIRKSDRSKAESLFAYLRECVANGHDILVRDRSGQNTVINIEDF